MVLFRFLFTIAVAAAAVVLWFLVVGVADGSVTGFNAGLWLMLVAVALGVPLGALALRRRGQIRPANALLLVLAGSCLLAGVVTLWLIVAPPSFH